MFRIWYNDAKGGIDVKTAKKMYKYCLKNGFGEGYNRKWGLKHFLVVEKNLQKDEDVYMTFIGIHNYKSITEHDGNFAYAITNKRILMGQKKIFGEDSKTVLLKMLNDVNSSTGFAMGTITFDTIKEEFNVWVNKEQADNILAEIQRILFELKDAEGTTTEASGVDEIRKYKALLDDGIISENDFEKKKKELLGL